MKITVYGAGYVGLVTSTCLAELGHDVVCVDIDAFKITQLSAGNSPIYEPGLAPMLVHNLQAHRLTFTTDIAMSVNHGDYQFIAVGTPPAENGAANLEFVFNVARSIAELRDRFCIIINKSTVPVTTGDQVQSLLQQILKERGLSIELSVVSNPEFLREGSAINDFMYPDRIIVGSRNIEAAKKIIALYAPLNLRSEQILMMDIHSAELCKYAANALLATKISFINELSLIAEKAGADIEYIRQGIALDPRIGPHFISAGCGYGGACFPKDVSALIATAHSLGVNANILEAVQQVNQRQKHLLFEKISHHFDGKLRGKVIAVWGLAFKPNTDDMREAPSCNLLESLWLAGAIVKAYDPVATKTAQRYYGSRHDLLLCEDALTATAAADALAIVTEWDVFQQADMTIVKKQLRYPVIFDGRNIYNPTLMKEMGFTYYGVGRI